MSTRKNSKTPAVSQENQQPDPADRTNQSITYIVEQSPDICGMREQIIANAKAYYQSSENDPHPKVEVVTIEDEDRREIRAVVLYHGEDHMFGPPAGSTESALRKMMEGMSRRLQRQVKYPIPAPRERDDDVLEV